MTNHRPTDEDDGEDGIQQEGGQTQQCLAKAWRVDG